MVWNTDPTNENQWKQLFTYSIPTHSKSKKAFTSIVGCTPQVVHTIWQKYLHEEGCDALTLLWMLSFLHVYPCNDIVMGTLWGVSDKTFFDAVWIMMHFLYDVIDEVCK